MSLRGFDRRQLLTGGTALALAGLAGPLSSEAAPAGLYLGLASWRTLSGLGRYRHATAPAEFLAPWTDLRAQLFKVDAGRITHLEELVRRVPYGRESGWGSPTVPL
jgi:hypothetical protein